MRGDEVAVEDSPYKLITRRIDTPKVRTHNKKDISVVITPVKDVKIKREKNPIRSGAIIYTRKDGKLYYCLGVDTKSGNLTDFSGGVKKGETVIEGGLRELREESLGIFGKIDPESIRDMSAIHCHNMNTMFIYRDVDMDNIVTSFRHKVRFAREPEVCDVIWLEKKDFLESIHGRGKHLYVRVRRLLKKVTTWVERMI